MNRLFGAFARLFVTPERPVYSVRYHTPAEYLRSRAAGADLVRVERQADA